MKHFFDVEIAKEYGVSAAVLIEHIAYWIKRNEERKSNYQGGKYWMYNSRRAYREAFPYLSERQIRTALKKLIDEGMVETGNYNKSTRDRTLWYTLTPAGKAICHFDTMDTDKMTNALDQKVISIGQNDPVDWIKTTNPLDQNDQPLPLVNPLVNPDINRESGTTPDADAPAKPNRHKYGMYNNVLLSDEEFGKLKAEFSEDWEQRIERLSEYIASTGRKYKNHLATIRAWARKDGAGHGKLVGINQENRNRNYEQGTGWDKVL